MVRRSRLPSLMLALALVFNGSVADGARQSTGVQARAAAAASASDGQAKPAPPPSPQPADFQALNDALALADARKRIEALDTFIQQYPDSIVASVAAAEMQDQLLRTFVEDAKRVSSLVDKTAPVNGGTLFACSAVAARLLGAGLLDTAEKVAQRGLAIDADQYAKEMLARADVLASAAGKGTHTGAFRVSFAGGRRSVTFVPQDAAVPGRRERPAEELREQFHSQHAELLTTLGLIHLKAGRLDAAEQALRAAYAEDQPPAAARELANMARKAGDEQAALGYLASCVLAGGPSAVRKEFDDAYRNTHAGTLDGAEALLDSVYLKSTRRIPVTRFERPRTRNAHVVLAELFTGAQCGPCVAVNLAFDAVLERFTRQDVVLLSYHVHIPGPDPMTNPSTEKRLAFYGVRRAPTYFIDGVVDEGGGGGPAAAERILKTRVEPALEKALASKPAARLSLDVAISGGQIKVKAATGRITPRSGKHTLQIALVEELVTYSGSNGVRLHPMVVRNLAGPGAGGFPAIAGKALSVECGFDIDRIIGENKKYLDDYVAGQNDKEPVFSETKPQLDPTRLAVVAFLQDDATRQVLQTAYLKVPAMAHR